MAHRRRGSAFRVTRPSMEARGRYISELTAAINRLAEVIQLSSGTSQVDLAGRTSSSYRTAVSRSIAQSPNRCNHPDGHELKLGPGEGLQIETARECPCCGARLWISLPSVGAILDAASSGGCSVPDLQVELTRRERQVLNVLHRSSGALRYRQLAGLVWSDPDRTHDVRSVLYELRRKLRNSGWAIPLPAKGKGVRLVADAPQLSLPVSAAQKPNESSTTLLHTAA
jgi:hypothetical protein